MKPKSGDTDALQHGRASRGAAPPRLPALAVAAVIQPPQDTKRCCCPAACSYTFRFSFVGRRNVLNAVSILFFFSPPQPRSTSAAPTGPAAAAYRSGPGPCLPFPATAPSIDGSKRRAGPRLGSNGCWRGTGGGRGGGIPRARTPAGPAAEHHPSILPARGGGGGDAAAPPRRRVGLGTTLDGEY